MRHLNAWVIQVGEPLPIDPGAPRMWRSGLLAQTLASRGHKVTWWASTFDHTRKIHRFSQDMELILSERLTLRLIHSPGYRSNISLSRLLDHKVLGQRFREAAEVQPRPDVIHCGYPTVELSYEAARYGLQHAVPVVLDARDLWPDIFVTAVPHPFRLLARLALRREFAQAREAFRLASAISGHTRGFVDFGLRYAGRPARPSDQSFPFGYPARVPSDAEIAAAREWWTSRGVPLDRAGAPVLCFFGAFMAQQAVDLSTVVRAAGRLSERGVDVRFVLCGDGPRLTQCREQARGLSNVILPGRVGYPQIWVLMHSAIAGVLPYLPARDYVLSIPNKAVEYLSAGLPVITSLTGGVLQETFEKHQCGLFYEGQNPGSLEQAVIDVLQRPERLAGMCDNARRLFQSHYDADLVYSSMADHLEAMASPCFSSPTRS